MEGKHSRELASRAVGLCLSGWTLSSALPHAMPDCGMTAFEDGGGVLLGALGNHAQQRAATLVRIGLVDQRNGLLLL